MHESGSKGKETFKNSMSLGMFCTFTCGWQLSS